MSLTFPTVLVFSATDPTCGAGLQADILTIASLGGHPLSVVTAITVQDTVGVDDFLPMDDAWITDQARCVLEDMPVAAFKLGMLGSVEAVAAIAGIVADYPDIPLVLDPVLASGRGDELADEALIDAMRDLLLPRATLITPNSLEARRLAADGLAREWSAADLADCADNLLDLGCEYVLITGAHEQTPQVSNLLYGDSGLIQRLDWDRLPGSYHGSGCTLATAIASLLAQGLDIVEAVKAAQEYTYETLRAGYRPGMGQFIPDRFFWARDSDDPA